MNNKNSQNIRIKYNKIMIAFIELTWLHTPYNLMSQWFQQIFQELWDRAHLKVLLTEKPQNLLLTLLMKFLLMKAIILRDLKKFKKSILPQRLMILHQKLHQLHNIEM
jgi:hypothetical protein